jgi:hypothetical protein
MVSVFASSMVDGGIDPRAAMVDRGIDPRAAGRS